MTDWVHTDSLPYLPGLIKSSARDVGKLTAPSQILEGAGILWKTPWWDFIAWLRTMLVRAEGSQAPGESRRGPPRPNTIEPVCVSVFGGPTCVAPPLAGDTASCFLHPPRHESCPPSLSACLGNSLPLRLRASIAAHTEGESGMVELRQARVRPCSAPYLL